MPEDIPPRKVKHMTSAKNGFVISLDFELIWGSSAPLEALLADSDKYEKTKECVKDILLLFDRFDIACTWATVGLLFDRIDQVGDENYTYNLPNYRNLNDKTFDKLAQLPLSKEYVASAPEVVEMILATPKQELASHTFSHFYVHDETSGDARVFEDDLKKAQHVALKIAGTEMKSLVFPRNQVGSLETLRRTGFVTYRGNPPGRAYGADTSEGATSMSKRVYRLLDRYLPLSGSLCYDLKSVQSDEALVNVPASRFLAPYITKLKIVEPLRINRIKREMTKAARSQETYHLWWHPHNIYPNTEGFMSALKQILEHYKYLNDTCGWESYTMLELAQSMIDDL